jgi:replicative DNA helicase
MPNSNTLIKYLATQPYNYSKSEVTLLVNAYFSGVHSWNENLAQEEEFRNRITFTWYDKNNNVSGFSFRKPTSVKVPSKYVFNNKPYKKAILFNINNWNIEDKKKLVIVEGPLDALSASYLSSEEIQKKYHFVAIGGKSLTEEQVGFIKDKGITEVILLIDNDAAGAKYQSSARNLGQQGISASIARMPDDYTEKDIDELLTKRPETRDKIFMTILENAEVEVNKDVNEIAQILILTAEEIAEQDKRKTELQQQLLDNNPIDLHILKRIVDQDKKQELLNTLSQKLNNKPVLKDILEQSKQYNDLLAVNYEEDEAYKNSTFLQDLTYSPQGLQTGFTELDKYVVIQPSTLNFVAGRPSHGKTTIMINILKNMIVANPEQAFLFYSYEETHVDIMLKIILSHTKDKDAELELEADKNIGNSYFAKAKDHLKKYAVAIEEDKGKMSSCATNLHLAYKDVEGWINERRLQIMTRKPNVESLSGSIIERVQKIQKDKKDDNNKIIEKGKKVAAIFIDYVQKLNTEEEKANRQQELHRVCKDLLNTSCDKRVEAAIILGAQANRDVKSLETFQLENMREAGDIEQDANLVIGVWDEEAGKKARLEQKLADARDKAENQKLGLTAKKGNSPNYENAVEKIITEQKNQKNYSGKKILTLKILKNRNGQNNLDCKVTSYVERFCIVSENTERKIEAIELNIINHHFKNED